LRSNAYSQCERRRVKDDRATSIDNGSQRLADYTWIGSAIHQRDTTCDYPGSTKPKFKTAFERDVILRVSKEDIEPLITALTALRARRQAAYKSAVRDHPGADQTPRATHAETPPAPPRSLLPSA